MPDNVRAVLPSSSGADLISLAGRKLTSDFGHAYRDLVKRAAIAGLQRVRDEAALARASIIGAVSTYNPFRGGKEEGGPQIASAELYDPLAWTAAIKLSCAIGFAAFAIQTQDLNERSMHIASQGRGSGQCRRKIPPGQRYRPKRSVAREPGKLPRRLECQRSFPSHSAQKSSQEEFSR
jgi:hypothetical protein